MTDEPFSLPDDLLRAIGRVTEAGARLEAVAAAILTEVLGHPGGAIVGAGQFFGDLYRLLKALAEYQAEEVWSPQLLAWLVESKSLYDQRNGVAHSVWWEGTEPDAAVSVKGRYREVHHVSKHTTVSELNVLADQLLAAVHAGWLVHDLLEETTWQAIAEASERQDD